MDTEKPIYSARIPPACRLPAAGRADRPAYQQAGVFRGMFSLISVALDGNLGRLASNSLVQKTLAADVP
jgi:hypothetical protein